MADQELVDLVHSLLSPHRLQPARARRSETRTTCKGECGRVHPSLMPREVSEAKDRRRKRVSVGQRRRAQEKAKHRRRQVLERVRGRARG